MVTNLKAASFKKIGHQFKGRVVWIFSIKAFHSAQSIVVILGRPIWWCEDGHGVAVIEL